MIIAEPHPSEALRLEELIRYEILDTEDEQVLDELTELASVICETEISLISLVDEGRQWFKSRVGLDALETPKSMAFCSHAILQEQVFEIENAKEDERFFDNPLVVGDPNIRFYAGAPLVTPKGLPIGTLCVIDPTIKKLSDHQINALKVLAKQVMSQLQLRLHYRQLQRISKEKDQVFAIIAHDLKSPFTGILGYSKMLQKKADSIKPLELAKMADGILNSSTKVYLLLEELLQWSCNKLGVVATHLQPTDIGLLLTETADFLSDSIQAKSLTLEKNIDNKTIAIADNALTKTVIRNLLTNAIKYTPINGSIVVNVSNNDNFVKVLVKNSGNTIPEQARKQLFNSCIVSKPGTLGEIGHGLGLSLCAELIQRQKGKIWVDDTYTDGACFGFSLAAAD